MQGSKIISHKLFLYLSCAAIFLISVFLRSKFDIGPDTAIYLDIARKITNGGRYYYDFFESNFPLSFYFYASEIFLSDLLKISPIITSEIVINLLALFSIFWSSKILKKTTIYENKAHYNLIIISYFLGFFLRIAALEITEFGSKTSLLLILLYPYISYSFERKSELKNIDLIYRGCLMGLIGCLKPHYLIIVICLELNQFLQKKSGSINLKNFCKFLFEIDRLLMILIGALYLFLMIKFTPEFFKFMVPMWSEMYSSYSDYEVFLTNTLMHFGARIALFVFVFLVFARINFTKNDRMLAMLFLSASLLMILENLSTVDQVAIFYSILTICILKVSFDFLTSKHFSIYENKFITVSVLLIPLFEISIMPNVIFSIFGGIIIWWWTLPLAYPYFFFKDLKSKSESEYKKIKREIFSFKKIVFFAFIYALLLGLTIGCIKYQKGNISSSINLVFLFLCAFFFEKRLQKKISNQFSTLSTFLIIASLSCLFYGYVQSLKNTFENFHEAKSPNKFTDAVAYYSKIYAPKKSESVLIFASPDSYQRPILNYLKKEDYTRLPSTMMAFEEGGKYNLFPIDTVTQAFTFGYLLDVQKSAVKNKNVKVVFVNKNSGNFSSKDYCEIGYLENFFLDPEFKKVFLKNFRFKNRVLVSRKTENYRGDLFSLKKNKDVFDKVKPSQEKIVTDFEIYVRK